MSFDSDDSYVPDPPSFGIFFLIKAGDAASWVRVWSGDGFYDLPADGTDTSGGRYMGIGFPVGLPAISQAINGTSSNIEFSMSGVDATALRLAGADRNLVNGALVYLGLVDIDEHQQPTTSCDWILEGQAGKPRVSRVGRDEGALRTISLPVSTEFVDRNRAAIAWWSPSGQRARSADDAFCDQVPTISAGGVYTWPA
jgi:hypothetical protein